MLLRHLARSFSRYLRFSRVVIALGVAMLAFPLFPGSAAAQACTCASLQPDKMAWRASINEADDAWHIVAVLNATFVLECTDGSRRESCFGSAHLVRNTATYRGEDENGVFDPNIFVWDEILFGTGTTSVMAATCGRDGTSRHVFRYLVAVKKDGVGADQIVGNSTFNLNVGCEASIPGFATPSLVIDTRDNAKLIDFDLSDLDGDSLDGFTEDNWLLGPTSDQDWDSDGDGAGDAVDGAPADRKCSDPICP